MTDSELFDDAVQQIDDKYAELGYSRGWRFLYTARSTLMSNCRLIVMGLNPADRKGFEVPNRAEWPSSEAGNSFRLRTGIASKQYAIRVCAIFERLAASLGQPRDALMDSTLTSNYCPFRASNGLPSQYRPKAVDFSQHLWHKLCEYLQPRVVLCFGMPATEGLKQMYTGLGFRAGDASLLIDTGWSNGRDGNYQFSFQGLISGNRTVTIVGMPHPSHFFIVGNPRFTEVTRAFISQLVSRL